MASEKAPDISEANEAELELEASKKLASATVDAPPPPPLPKVEASVEAPPPPPAGIPKASEAEPSVEIPKVSESGISVNSESDSSDLLAGIEPAAEKTAVSISGEEAKEIENTKETIQDGELLIGNELDSTVESGPVNGVVDPNTSLDAILPGVADTAQEDSALDLKVDSNFSLSEEMPPPAPTPLPSVANEKMEAEEITNPAFSPDSAESVNINLDSFPMESEHNTSYDPALENIHSVASDDLMEDAAAPIQSQQQSENPEPNTKEIVSQNEEVLQSAIESAELKSPGDSDLIGNNPFAVAKAKMAEDLFSLVLCEQKFDDLTQTALEYLMEAVSAESGSILEQDHEREEFFFRAVVGNGSDKLKSFRIPAFKGIVGHVAESRKPLLLRDTAEDANHLESISIAVGFEAKCCIAFPIIIQNQMYAVLELFNKKANQTFDESDLELVASGVEMLVKVLEVRFFVAELMKR